MFMAYKRKLELWTSALEGMGVDKKTIQGIVNAPKIPEHWRK